MTKSEKLFEMLQLIKEYPGLTAKDLARLCSVSERGVYRYINTLSNADISIRFQDGGYRLQEDYSNILRKSNTEGLDALRELVSLGMQNCEDRQLLGHGREFMALIERNLPRSRKRPLDGIETVPKGVSATHNGGTIIIGHSTKPDIINPILTSETISVNLMNLIFSSLVKIDSAGKPIPDLAKRWEVSDDGLIWTFFLRDDVEFHDGHPLTAHDVEFTYKAMMDPKNSSTLAERHKRLIDRVEATEDYIFRVSLKHPFAPFICGVVREIAPKHLLENVDLHSTPFNRRPVGTGPFKLTDWTENDTIILDANSNYFLKGRPILDRLVFKAYPDRKAALKAISRGEMDLALDLAAPDLVFASNRRTFRVYPASNAAYYAIFFNLNDPLFRDIRVRKALDYAVDRNSIVNRQLKGRSKICTGPFSIDSWAYNPDILSNPYSVQEARKLLEQAGWRDEDGDGVLVRNGKPFEFSITVPEISDSLERIAIAIRAQLMKVGIRTKILYIDEPEPYQTPFQATLFRISTGIDPDYISRFWHSTETDYDLVSYKNSAVDDLLGLGKRTGDLEERRAIYHKIHRMIHDDYPAIFLASAYEFIGSNYRFIDAKLTSASYLLTSMKDWQIVSQESGNIARERRQKANITL